MTWLIAGNRTLTALEGTDVMPAGGKLTLARASAESSDGKQRHAIKEWQGTCAWIYGNPIAAYERHRIEHMIELNIGAIAARQLSWPFDIIVNGEGKAVGYLASYVHNAVSLRQLFQMGPSMPESKRICIGKNLCKALCTAHGLNLVFGCLTIDKIMVRLGSCQVFLDPQTNVQFVDAGGELFPCRLGVSEYLPPEIHALLAHGGRLYVLPEDESSPSGAEHGAIARQGERRQVASAFTRDSDLFALGVIVFALLNKGMHPLSHLVQHQPDIPKLNDCSRSEFPRPRAMPEMMGTRPRSSPFEGTLGIPAYRLPWNRPFASGPTFDRCFGNSPSLSRRSRPSAEDWFFLLERVSNAPRARVRLFLEKLSRLIEMRFADAAPATSYSTREFIRRQLPPDRAGSEQSSTPRVFWRTTGLFAIASGLCAGLAMLGLRNAFSIPVPEQTHAFSPVIGALTAMLLANVLISRKRDVTGFATRDYLVSFAASLTACISLGILFGGAT